MSDIIKNEYTLGIGKCKKIRGRRSAQCQISARLGTGELWRAVPLRPRHNEGRSGAELGHVWLVPGAFAEGSH